MRLKLICLKRFYIACTLKSALKRITLAAACTEKYRKK